jgi:hypothetical protein
MELAPTPLRVPQLGEAACETMEKMLERVDMVESPGLEAGTEAQRLKHGFRWIISRRVWLFKHYARSLQPWPVGWRRPRMRGRVRAGDITVSPN